MSPHARKMLPAEVLSHPAVTALIERGTTSRSVTPAEVRDASDAASVEPRHLKALLGHLSGLGIIVDVDASSSRVVAAARPTSASTAKKATAKKAAARA